jgi:hypothetical protein
MEVFFCNATGMSSDYSSEYNSCIIFVNEFFVLSLERFLRVAREGANLVQKGKLLDNAK